MITPDLPLARAITTAVLDRIERDRTISSEGITEAVLGKLLYANAVAGEAPKASGGDQELVTAARALVDALPNDRAWGAPSTAVMNAWINLDTALRRRGA